MGAAKRESGGSGNLTDAECRNAKTRETPYKLTDGAGMYLLVQPHGAKLWRLKYRLAGREQTYSIGAYPDVGLGEARANRATARAWIREGKQPTLQRRVEAADTEQQRRTTFGPIAEEWFADQAKAWSEAYIAEQRTRLDKDLLPYLEKLPIKEIGAPLLLEILKRIARRGAHETAFKCRVLLSRVFRYAVQTGRTDSDPAATLAGALTRPPSVRRATVPLDEMPQLFAAAHAVPSELVTKLALYWLILTATRTHETRFATWAEIEGRKLWRIPPERMKMRVGHVVPLSRAAVKVLELAEPLRNDTGLIFPGFTRHGALSENALLSLLARAGYFGRQTGHGFRASFSTWAHETAHADPDVIEACLAHIMGGVRGTYNRSAYLPQRKALLQAWADQCEAWGMRL